jgi:uncharacterized membrane protein
VFRPLVLLKGLNGLLELGGGAAFLFLQTGMITVWVEILTKHELWEDPHDLLARPLTHWATSLGHDRHMFVAGYSTSRRHGLPPRCGSEFQRENTHRKATF